MRSPSPLAASALLLTLVFAGLCVDSSTATNRLVHRGGASPKGGLRELLETTGEAIQEGVQAIAQRVRHGKNHKKGGQPMDRFAVLHADSTGVDALNVLLDAQTASSDVWLYGDIPRWSPTHVEHLWSFACGRTQGRWPMCGKEGLGADPFDPVSVRDHERLTKLLHGFGSDENHKHEASPRRRRRQQKRGGKMQQPAVPRAVGFGLDLNVLLGDQRTRPALTEAEARLVVIVPGSLSRAALRDAAHGTLSPLTALLPGRAVGVARSQYAPDAPFQSKGRHLNLLCGTEIDPQNLVTALRRQESERDALRAAAEDLRGAGLAVLELDLDEILDRPGEALSKLYGFLLGEDYGVGKGDAAEETVAEPVRGLLAQLAVTPDILDDCAEALESTRVRLAVDDGQDAKALIADLDGTLSEIKRLRKIHQVGKKHKRK